MGNASTSEDTGHMRRCIELARSAGQRGEAPVGAVVVRDGRAVAEAGERTEAALDVAAHAEVEAIRLACRALGTLDLGGSTLYTSAEPCVMCSYAIRQARIARVVIGAPTPHIGGISSRYPILGASDVPGWPVPPAIAQGVLRAECVALCGEG